MLLRATDDGLLAIGQTSHAWLSGQLARAWGNPAFGAVSPREEVCLAAEQHDIGMAELDTRPLVDERTGRPRDFLHLPVATHLRLWRAAPDRLLMQSTYAALLCSMHGAALQRLRNLNTLAPEDADDVRAYLGEQREVQQRLQRALGCDDEELDRNQRLLWTWDAISLALCLDWAPYVQRDVPTADATTDLRLTADDVGGGHALDPWPFAAATVTVHAEGRLLPDVPYTDEEQLRTALDCAPLRRCTFALLPRR